MLAENKGGISIIFVTIVKRLFNLDNCLARAKFVLEISKKITSPSLINGIARLAISSFLSKS